MGGLAISFAPDHKDLTFAGWQTLDANHKYAAQLTV
jgi:hypothetical protein